MSDCIPFLVVIVSGDKLFKFVLRVKPDALPSDCLEHPMKHQSRKRLHVLLPFHIGEIGPIVDVERISGILDGRGPDENGG